MARPETRSWDATVAPSLPGWPRPKAVSKDRHEPLSWGSPRRPQSGMATPGGKFRRRICAREIKMEGADGRSPNHLEHTHVCPFVVEERRTKEVVQAVGFSNRPSQRLLVKTGGLASSACPVALFACGVHGVFARRSGGCVPWGGCLTARPSAVDDPWRGRHPFHPPNLKSTRRSRPVDATPWFDTSSGVRHVRLR